METLSAKRLFLIHLAFAPFGVLALAIAIVSRDWRLILFASAFGALFAVRLASRWSDAFPDRSKFLSRWFQDLPARFSTAQKAALSLLLSVPTLLFLIFLLGFFGWILLGAVLISYAVAGVRVLWIIRREGWSGGKRT